MYYKQNWSIACGLLNYWSFYYTDNKSLCPLESNGKKKGGICFWWLTLRWWCCLNVANVKSERASYVTNHMIICLLVLLLNPNIFCLNPLKQRIKFFTLHWNWSATISWKCLKLKFRTDSFDIFTMISVPAHRNSHLKSNNKKKNL